MFDDEFFDTIISGCKKIINLAENAKTEKGDNAALIRSGAAVQIIQTFSAMGTYLQSIVVKMQLRGQ